MTAFNSAAAEGAAEGLKLFACSALPCLFPFMVCGQYFTTLIEGRRKNAGKPRKKSSASAPFRMLKGLLAACVCAVCGIPSAAMICGAEACSGVSLRLSSMKCAVMNTVNPVFIIGFLSSKLLLRPGLAPLFAAAHYLTALAGAALLSLWDKRPSCPLLYKAREREIKSPLNALGVAITGASAAALRICGTVVFFRVVIAVAEEAGAGALLGPRSGAFAAGIFEMTNGLALLAGTAGGSGLGPPLMSFIMSFGGICVYMQSAMFFEELEPLWYFAAKLVCAACSFALCRLLYPLFCPLEESAAVFLPLAEVAAPAAESVYERGVMLLYAGLSFAVAGAVSFLYSRVFIRRRLP